MITKEQRNKIVVEQKKFVNYLDKNNLRLTKARIEAGVIMDQSKMTMMTDDSVMNHYG